MTSSRIFTETITVNSPCTLTELHGSLTLGDFFLTAQPHVENRPGTGTTVEIRSWDNTTEITGHTSAFCDLSLPINQLAEDDFTISSNNYITAKLRGESYMSTCELNDLLNGCGWKMLGLTSYMEKNPRGQSKLKTHSVWAKKHSKKKT